MDLLFNETILRIKNAPINAGPFSHLLIEDIFPESLYSEILKNLPDAFYYQDSKFSHRQDILLNEDHFLLFESDPHLFNFWSQFKKALCSDLFLFAVLEKFQIAPKKKPTPIARLIKNKGHYSIGPHTDIPEKLISLLFYLPTSKDQIHLGTSLYQPLDPTYTCPDGTQYPFEQFSLLKKAPFLPNSVFGFLRTDTSFHGVEPIGKDEKERNMIGYTIWE